MVFVLHDIISPEEWNVRMTCDDLILSDPPEIFLMTHIISEVIHEMQHFKILYVVRHHVARIKSEIIKAQKAWKTLGKPNWAMQLSSFLSFWGGYFSYNEVRQIVYRFKA